MIVIHLPPDEHERWSAEGAASLVGQDVDVNGGRVTVVAAAVADDGGVDITLSD